MIPTNREEFSSYCLRKLGDPVIQINVSVPQIEDRIDEALYKFYERHFEGVEEVYIVHDITDPVKILDSNGEPVLDSDGLETYTTGTDTQAGFIQLEDDIVGVVDVFRPRISGNSSSISFTHYMQELYAMIHPNNITGGMAYYYMTRSHLALMDQFFNPDRRYTYNALTNKLVIAGGLKDSDTRYGGVIVRAFRKVHGQERDSNTLIHNIWKSRWLQSYACALLELQWGQNLSKFNQIALIGGVTLNGLDIYSRAIEKIKELESELELSYELPPTGFMG